MNRLRRSLGLLGPEEDLETAEDFGIDPAAKVESEGSIGSAEGYQLGPDQGIRIHPMPITAESELTIAYSGLLAESGASKVYLRCGEGPGDWSNVRDIPMEHQPDSNEWVALLEAGDGGTLEFCFHDGVGNWDNNDGRNWSAIVHGGKGPH